MEIRKLKKGQLIMAKCEKLVSEGLGLSYLLENQVPYPVKPIVGFIWGVLPGETFVAEVRKVSSKCFHAVLVEHKNIPEEKIEAISQYFKQPTTWGHTKWALLNTAENRVEPSCDNFVLCGGCKLMHISYEETLQLKLKWLNELLNTIPNHSIQSSITPAPKQFHYRNNVQVHINKYMQRGFFSPMTYRTIAFPESGCQIFNQKIFDANFPEPLKLERCVRSRIDENTDTAKIWALYSKEDKTDTFDYHIKYPKNSLTKVTLPNLNFFQVNTSFIPLWLEKIKNLIPKHLINDSRPIKIIELFSGFGFISKTLSLDMPIISTGMDILEKQQVQQVTLSNEHYTTNTIEKFNETYIKQDITKLDTISKETIEVLSNFKADLIIINPPRAGFEPNQITFFYNEILKKKNIPIIYSSCDAATMVRDINTFIHLGYTIDSLEALDFFPWTSHYEVLGLLY